MDSDAIKKRTEKIIEILEADERLDDGLETEVHVHKGLPHNRLESLDGYHVFVHWDQPTIIHNRRQMAGAKQDWDARFAVWFYVSDYSDEEAAETKFEILAANIDRVLSDYDNLQVAKHWLVLELVSGGAEALPIGTHAFWRLGRLIFRMVFWERIN